MVSEETNVYCLTPKNCLILILCCWLLKKTLVIMTNLTNPESVPASNTHSTCKTSINSLVPGKFVPKI